MVCMSTPRVRAAFLIKAFTFEKASSMGEKSGERTDCTLSQAIDALG